MITSSTRIIDIKPKNRIKTVQKQEDGNLSITQHSGASFTISRDDEMLQAFAVYSILYEL